MGKSEYKKKKRKEKKIFFEREKEKLLEYILSRRQKFSAIRQLNEIIPTGYEWKKYETTIRFY